MDFKTRINPFFVIFFVACLFIMLTQPAQATGLNFGDTINNTTNNVTNNKGGDASANAGAIALGGGGFGGQGGNVSINNPAADFGDLRIVPSAIAPNVVNNVVCPMVAGGSKAGSVFFFSGSGTHAPELVTICVAFHLGQFEVVEQLTCAKDSNYRKANGNCIQDGETVEQRDERVELQKALAEARKGL